MQAEKMKTKKGKKKKQTAGLSKRDLHRAISERTGLSKKRVTEVFAALEDVLADQMKTDGGRIYIARTGQVHNSHASSRKSPERYQSLYR